MYTFGHGVCGLPGALNGDMSRASEHIDTARLCLARGNGQYSTWRMIALARMEWMSEARHEGTHFAIEPPDDLSEAATNDRAVEAGMKMEAAHGDLGTRDSSKPIESARITLGTTDPQGRQAVPC